MLLGFRFGLVSILVLMDVGLKLCNFVYNLVCVLVVSILVLMDVGLKHERNIGTYKFVPRFNPCFDGCWSKTTGWLE